VRHRPHTHAHIYKLTHKHSLSLPSIVLVPLVPARPALVKHSRPLVRRPQLHCVKVEPHVAALYAGLVHGGPDAGGGDGGCVVGRVDERFELVPAAVVLTEVTMEGKRKRGLRGGCARERVCLLSLCLSASLSLILTSMSVSLTMRTSASSVMVWARVREVWREGHKERSAASRRHPTWEIHSPSPPLSPPPLTAQVLLVPGHGAPGHVAVRVQLQQGACGGAEHPGPVISGGRHGVVRTRE